MRSLTATIDDRALFLWKGARNYVEINSLVAPAHIFKLRQRVRTEHVFDYFL